MARIVGVTYYPVKGCAGVAVAASRVTADGLEHDREYVVVDEARELRWQWGDPRLALITPELGPEPGPGPGSLTLRAPGCGEVRVSGEPGESVTLPGRSYGGVDQGDAAAGWLTEVLGRPTRLLRVRRREQPTDVGAPGALPVANHSRLHVVSRASLDELNRRLAERGVPPLPMNRFRPNLVVDGWTAPHTEDDARRMTIAGADAADGPLELALTELTVRCAITMVDQETGRRASPEPLRTLADYRRADGGIVFGAYFTVRRPGKAAVGDEVTAWKE
ncbi:MOSC domain-containing protein [Streptomyces sp. NBC_01275]|uniref:MOSC domain-containing protein n=1 Tax=Streptomyces sp. NBC_01275 TaxID=2903807 RepID=UPI0022594319|nr:MOSC N-terminal beta barrel domain-containing protein [Streptomyces sp. NBC_01275]MCX4763561.1 MOSC domain-containing protein [Streptomyces sp. NBC_01275]